MYAVTKSGRGPGLGWERNCLITKAEISEKGNGLGRSIEHSM